MTTYTVTGETFDHAPVEWHGEAIDAEAAALELRVTVALEVWDDFRCSDGHGTRHSAAIHLVDPDSIIVVDEDARRAAQEDAWTGEAIEHMDAVSAYPPNLRAAIIQQHREYRDRYGCNGNGHMCDDDCHPNYACGNG